MKLLVGCFVLGCISAVLVLAEVASEKSIKSSSVTGSKISIVEDAVTEKLITSLPDLTQRIQHSESTPSPDKNSKIFSSSPSVKGNIDREIVVIRDQAPSGGVGHHDHGNHDHHGYHDHDHHHDHEHDYHHPPPPRPPPPHHQHDHHHHPPPPPHYHHFPQPYPSYYPPHYPPPYSHGMPQPYASGAAIPPPYPYYPPPTYYSSPPMKPSATIIQTSSTSGQNYPKPTDLLNQGTEYLWNLFGKLGAVTSENHEVVLINPKPSAPLAATSVHVLPPNWYSNKGKIIPNIDCNNKNN